MPAPFTIKEILVDFSSFFLRKMPEIPSEKKQIIAPNIKINNP